MKEKRMINSKLQHPPPYNPLAFWPWGAEFEPTNLEKFKHPVYCLRVEVGDSVRNLNPWPPIWLVSSVGSALHRYCRGHELKSYTGLDFFRPYFHYCNDRFHIHFFARSSRMIFIYLQSIVILQYNDILVCRWCGTLEFMRKQGSVLYDTCEI